MARIDCQRRYVRSKLLRLADPVATADQMDRLLTASAGDIRRFLRKMGVIPPDKRKGQWERNRKGDPVMTKVGDVTELVEVEKAPKEAEPEKLGKMAKKHIEAVTREKMLVRARESGLVNRGLMEKEEWEKRWGPWPVASIPPTS
jgi:hypothetical protein